MIIAFSGASHSGKTTFINVLKDTLKENVIVFDEIIRDKISLSIDEIRKDSNLYFNTQLKIISQKIKQEVDTYKTQDKDKLYIFDRSIIDSYFYYMFYVDKSTLSPENADKYFDFLHTLQKYVKFAMNKIYDCVFLFTPIDSTNNTDEMRPKNLSYKQQQEYNIIRDLSIIYKNKIIDFNALSNQQIFNFIKEIFKIIPSNYKDYRISYEENYYETLNILTNTYGSVFVEEKYDINDMLWKACLFTDDKMSSDLILEDIKMMTIEEEYMNSRCYPTGLWKKNNIMFVGEAPGIKGRSIKGYDLKPSFIFTRTSYLLRNAFRECEEMPYITNLLKYARAKNNVSHEDFEKTFYILQKEIELMQPRKIIALGNNAYNFLLTKDIKIPMDKCLHPAGAFYKGLTEQDYSTIIKGKL